MGEGILVVGAGFSGAVVARELADAGIDVTLIDKRGHIGGNAHDHTNPYGIRIHTYGPHLFHTANQRVVEWLSRFTTWIPYQHKVKAQLGNGELVTLPVNKETAEKVGVDRIIDTFYRPYTQKMWGMEIEQLDPDILRRLPIRDDLNEYYFPDDPFQALPENGYTALIHAILSHPRIEVKLNTPFQAGMQNEHRHTFNSMPIDEFFEFKLGRLPYRSIKFHHVDLPVPRLYPVATVNFTHSHPYTRVTEWKNLPGNPQGIAHTSLTIEEPCADHDNHFERYYPVKDIAGVNKALYQTYRERVPENMTFIGRCGQYVYLNMDQAVNAARTIAQKFIAANIR